MLTPHQAGPEKLPLRVRVLILTASMGAGHDGAARELASRLRGQGHEAVVRDFLDSAPLRIGHAVRRIYELELRRLPSAYDMTYRLWYRAPWLCGPLARFVTFLTRRRVSAWMRAFEPTVVVSTYPLATLCLGQMRRTRRLRVPAVNFITDFGVHPLWVHPSIDLNLTVHDAPAAEARSRSDVATVACGPAVSPEFDPANAPGRDEARTSLGLDPAARIALVVAGSWGVGSVEPARTAVLRAGFVPVILCGKADRLRDDLATLEAGDAGPSVVLGWTDDMASLIAGSDVVVENAGGLTSFEAMRAGIPVVTFLPIAGHGKENARAMAGAGVVEHATHAAALERALELLAVDGPRRRAQVRVAQDMFRSDPSTWIVKASTGADLDGVRTTPAEEATPTGVECR